MDADDGFLRVGDLARSTGLTVRALHHYEDIGLLAPMKRTPAGHRLYDTPAVERLYRIGLLKRYGMPLDQIRHALEDPDWTLEAALARHLGQIETEIDQLHQLRAGLTPHSPTSTKTTTRHQT